LTEQPAESRPKSLFGNHVEKLHGFGFHRIDQPDPVNEFACARPRGLVELWQFFRRHRQIRVKNEQQISGCGPQTPRALRRPCPGFAASAL